MHRAHARTRRPASSLYGPTILAAARRIYRAAWFRLVSEAPHHSFGRDPVGQTWTLDLAQGEPRRSDEAAAP
jgi:hypothetical protein